MSEIKRRKPLRVVALISGRGSNLQALLAHPQHRQSYEIVAVLSNKPSAPGLDLALSYGVQTRILQHTGFPSRELFDEALVTAIDAHAPDLVVLAGFMRILSNGFVAHYAQRLMNIHPSLLPSFAGLNTHQRAIDAGCQLHGATVHFVTAELDHGPIVAQAAVEIAPDDTPDTLAARVLQREHEILPACVLAFAHGQLQLDGLRVLWHGQRPPVFTSKEA